MARSGVSTRFDAPKACSEGPRDVVSRRIREGTGSVSAGCLNEGFQTRGGEALSRDGGDEDSERPRGIGSQYPAYGDGRPTTGAPQRVRDAAKAALDDTHLCYTEALGLPGLRKRVARTTARPMTSISRPIGSSSRPVLRGGFLLSFLSAFDAGDRVVLGAPCYPAYRNILAALDLEPIIVADRAGFALPAVTRAPRLGGRSY